VFLSCSFPITVVLDSLFIPLDGSGGARARHMTKPFARAKAPTTKTFKIPRAALYSIIWLDNFFLLNSFEDANCIFIYL
jgi:hypothetical protein